MSKFPADSRLVRAVMPSPNHGERRGAGRPDILLLHYTGMPSAELALERLCDPASEVSAHYVVLEDGGTLQCVPESRRAWHAGVSCWEGERDINSRSIGIEIVNAGHDAGCPDFPDPQIAAVVALCREIVARHGIVATRVLAHSDVAPARKRDPGEKFPWETLAKHGIGLWVAPAPLGPPEPVTGAAVRELYDGLVRYGYCLPATGDPDAVVSAFQRHFRPARVDGIPDASTLATLRRLLEARRA